MKRGADEGLVVEEELELRADIVWQRDSHNSGKPIEMWEKTNKRGQARSSVVICPLIPSSGTRASSHSDKLSNGGRWQSGSDGNAGYMLAITRA